MQVYSIMVLAYRNEVELVLGLEISYSKWLESIIQINSNSLDLNSKF